MDVALARVLDDLRRAAHEVDPRTPVGIEGTQMPHAFGGYDLWRLAQALDWVEPYDIGNNIEMLRSFAPRLPFVTTAFARGQWEKHRIWYELLHGARGNIIWDEKFEMAPDGGKPGPRGDEVAPYYNEVRNGIGALLIQSERQSDPVAIHYSQPSLRVEWMLAQREKGDAWVKRSSSKERLDSEFLRLRESYCKLVEDLGLQYRFVSYAQVEDGELLRRGYRVLVLPRSTALSAAEAREIKAFVAQGGAVIADGEPGRFDEHGRKLTEPSLAGVAMTRWNALPYYQDRLLGKESDLRREAATVFEHTGVGPQFVVAGDAVGIETHTFRSGAVSIVALLSNPELRVDELGPPEFKSNGRFEKARSVRLVLPREYYAYDIRAGKTLGKRNDVSLTLDPYEPAIFAVSPTPVPPLRLSLPKTATRGEIVPVAFRFDRTPPGGRQVLHIDVLDPSGKLHRDYSGNVLVTGGAGVRPIPLAVNDPAGNWTIRVHDVISGQHVEMSLPVRD